MHYVGIEQTLVLLREVGVRMLTIDEQHNVIDQFSVLRSSPE